MVSSDSGVSRVPGSGGCSGGASRGGRRLGWALTLGALLLGASAGGCSSAHVKRTETGYASLYEGDLDQAQADFDAALKKVGDYEPALTGLGMVALERGELDAAKRWFDQAVAADKTADAFYGRGQAQLRLFQWDAARADLGAAVEGGMAEANLEYGIALMLVGDAASSLIALDTYSKLGDTTVERRLAAASAAYRVGVRHTKAAEALRIVEAVKFEDGSYEAAEQIRLSIDLAILAADPSAAMRAARKATPNLDFGFVFRELSPVAKRSFEGVGGAVIDYVHLGSPAERAGLKAGDILTGFEAAPVTSAAQLREAIDTFQKQSQQQEQALLEVFRDGTFYGAYMRLGEFDFDNRIRSARDGVEPPELGVAPDDLAQWP